jgi:RNA polymerase sigma-70 factor (ECF subfamily)
MINPQPNEFSLEALRSGDQAEFARLVDTYSGPIYRLGLRILGSSQDAEDVLQNTFLNASHIFRALGHQPVKWFYRIASNDGAR